MTHLEPTVILLTGNSTILRTPALQENCLLAIIAGLAALHALIPARAEDPENTCLKT
ncbi:MAG TPA: hypothetical protein VEC01_19725 [Noviherbaspirillum sp.]|uniref:hypothetical protein n=1 Tax=Noviherbaspirillum sp. TaxID=1926288 RepID=UPI002D5DA312|nr:hypothetical protein [Noviherbaspirillum sp.]HYD97559.1 hypothetical protein [Noviherbaspirillum sp.]